MLFTNRFVFQIFFTFILVFGFLSCEKESPEPESTLATDVLAGGTGLRVGSAVVNINPENPTDVDLEGYEPRHSTGINDTITSRCVVIADDSSVVAMIALDLIGITKYQCNEIKAQIKKSTGLLEENIFIHAIHTHSAPSMMDGKMEQNYFSGLGRNTANAVVLALQSITNVKAVVRSGISGVNTVNRRNPERDVLNEFIIIEFQNEMNENVASILSFSCHPVVLGPNNTKISADFVHYLRKAVEDEIGGTAVYFNGSLGNINPARAKAGNPYDRSDGTFAMAKSFGDELANDMLFNYRVHDTAKVTIRMNTNKVNHIGQSTYVSILDLGIIQFAMMPGEPLESFGEDVKKLLPGTYKIIVGLTDDYIGYIIPQTEWQTCTNSFISECYEETVGGGEEVADILMEGFVNLTDYMY
jgi:hypothetical protein